LLEAEGKVVTRDCLRAELWQADTFVDFEHGVNTAIRKLRQALQDSAERPKYIETLTKRGYRFIAPIEWTAREAASAVPDSLFVTTGQAKPGISAPEQLQILTPKRLMMASAALGLLLVAAAGFYYARSLMLQRSAAIRSLAVLPLENLSGDPSQDYFSDGITEALITDLANIGVPRVISQTSVMRYKGTRQSLPEIARELNVDGVVEGAVFRDGERVRVTAQLLYAPADRHVWADTYDRNARDVLSIQGDIAKAIATAIKLKINPADQSRLAEPHQIDPAVHDAYLRGRYFWNQRTSESLTKAKEYFEESIARDPLFAPAYSGLADVYFYRGYAWGKMSPREAMPLARAAAQEALELDDNSAEAHASIGAIKFTYDWDFPGAEVEFKRAIALNPNYVVAHHFYSVLLAAMGRTEESLTEIRKAQQIDPLSVVVNNMVSVLLASAGRCEEAIRQNLKTLELTPNAPHLAMIHDTQAHCYWESGMQQQAIEEDMQARIAGGASPTEVEEIRKLYASSGRRGVLQNDLQAHLANWKKDQWHADAYGIAMLYAQLGDRDKAYAWIERSIQLRSTILIWLYISSPPSLRSDLRFAQVRNEMGVSR
jgi:TolB-like protein/Tfp pilus assembly protein PilF